MKRAAIIVGVIAALLVGGWFAIGGRMGLLLIAASMRKPDVAPNREIAWMPGPDTRAPGDARPNIIVILADDLGFNDVTFYGGGVAGGRVPTPNIDAIARNGVNFTRGYAGNATCAPSRAALVTGRYSTRFGFEFTPTSPEFAKFVGHFESGFQPTIYHEEREPLVPPMSAMGVPAAEESIGELLSRAGYHTMHFGKWHLGETPGANTPADMGFAESLGFYAGASMFLPEDHPDVVNSKQEFDPIDLVLWAALPWAVKYNGSDWFEPRGYMTDYLTEEAIKAAKANRNRPFFMYLAYNTVHTPLQALKADYDALSFISDHTLRVYAAMVKNLDDNVGRLIAALKAEGLYENTLIIFTSDNGGANYIGLEGLNDPYRGWKATFFEGGIRVPFFMQWPGHIPAGTTYANAISHFDVFATSAAAAGVSLPADRIIDGVDLLPFVTGARTDLPHETLFWRSGPYKVITQGDWKLQVTETPRKDWLYNLADDPGERNNLAATMPEKVAELRALLEAYDAQQVAPIWPALVEGPFALDRPLGKPPVPGEEYIYWSN